jgi:hypothetical protein
MIKITGSKKMAIQIAAVARNFRALIKACTASLTTPTGCQPPTVNGCTAALAISSTLIADSLADSS